MPKAVVLLSGGLDSTTTLAIAKNEGYEPYTMTFRYGQRHDVEIQCAQKIAQQFGVQDHVIVDIDLRSFGGSALTGDFDVPKGRLVEEMDAGIQSLAEKLTTSNPDSMRELKEVMWEGTEHWDSLLLERAAMSGTRVLSDFTQETLNKLKQG